MTIKDEMSIEDRLEVATEMLERFDDHELEELVSKNPTIKETVKRIKEKLLEIQNEAKLKKQIHLLKNEIQFTQQNIDFLRKEAEHMLQRMNLNIDLLNYLQILLKSLEN